MCSLVNYVSVFMLLYWIIDKHYKLQFHGIIEVVGLCVTV